MTWNEYADAVCEDPATHRVLINAIQQFRGQDPVDAYRNAQLLLEICTQRVDQMTKRPIDSTPFAGADKALTSRGHDTSGNWAVERGGMVSTYCGKCCCRLTILPDGSDERMDAGLLDQCSPLPR